MGRNATYHYQIDTRTGETMNPLDTMRSLTEPVWDRPTAERQLPKLGRGRPSKEIERERLRLLQLGYLSPGTQSSPTSRAIQKAIHDQEDNHAENQEDQGGGAIPAQVVQRRGSSTGAIVAGAAGTEQQAEPAPSLTQKQRMNYRVWAENMQESIDRMTKAGAWHSVAYQTAKRDEWLRLAAEPPPLRGNG